MICHSPIGYFTVLDDMSQPYVLCHSHKGYVTLPRIMSQGSPTVVELETNTEEKMQVSSTESHLYLNCLDSSHSGEYTCVALIPDREIRMTMNLAVSKSP